MIITKNCLALNLKSMTHSLLTLTCKLKHSSKNGHSKSQNQALSLKAPGSSISIQAMDFITVGAMMKKISYTSTSMKQDSPEEDQSLSLKTESYASKNCTRHRRSSKNW